MFVEFADHCSKYAGIGGEKCDECAVGFVQEGELTPETPVLDRKIEHDEMPACIECGECFTNWNRILTELKNATEMKVTGYIRPIEDIFTNHIHNILKHNRLLSARTHDSRPRAQRMRK